MTQTQTTTPPRGLSRRAFLAGLGAIAMNTALPYKAFASIHQVPLQELTHADSVLTIVLGRHEQPIVWQHIDSHFTLSDDYAGGYQNGIRFKDDVVLAPHGRIDVVNACKVLYPRSVLDNKTGELYDLDVAVDISVISYSDSPITFDQCNRGCYQHNPNTRTLAFSTGFTGSMNYPVYNNVLHCRVLKDGTLVDKPVSLFIRDLDSSGGRTRERHQAGYTDEETLEGVHFLTPINDVYIPEGSLLLVSEGGTKFTSPGQDAFPPGYVDTNYNPECLLLTSSTGGQFSIAWQGSIGCGTNIAGTSYGYPNVPADPLKETINNKLYL